MPRVRLTGLILFITAILLSLASAATRTSHIRVYQPGTVDERSPATDRPGANAPLFKAVPIVYPLAAVGFAGLMLWFMPASIFPRNSQSRKARKPKTRGGRSTRRKTKRRR